MGFGQIATWMPGMEDPIAEKKEVVFRPATATDTIRVGDLVCYNSDVAADHEERTSNPSSLGTTYAEGAQTYVGRLLIVEKPATANLKAFAGVVAQLGPLAGKDGDRIQIYVLKGGAVVPVYTNANCTLDATVLGVANGSYLAQVPTGDGDPLPIGVAMETVDRSSTNGLVWVRMFSQLGVGVEGSYFAPKRAVTTGDAYGVRFEISDLLTGAGTGGSRSWGVGITGDKESGAISVAGADDAALRISVNNYVANTSVFNFRGLNCTVANRDGGTVGELSNTISISLKQGSTTSLAKGLIVDAQDLAATAKDEFGGIDVSLDREGLAATIEYGVQIRTRGTINTAINTAIRITKDATDHGFINLFNIESDAVDVEAATGDTAHDTSDIVIPIVYNGSTYYIVAQDSKG